MKLQPEDKALFYVVVGGMLLIMAAIAIAVVVFLK